MKINISDGVRKFIIWIVSVAIAVVVIVGIGFRDNDKSQIILTEELAMSLIREQFPAPIAERIQFEHDIADYDIYMYDFGSQFIYYTIHFNHTKYDCDRNSNDLKITFYYDQYQKEWEISKFDWPNYANYDNYPIPDLV